MSYMITGSVLKKMRESAGLTQAAVAKLAGVSQAHVAKIEGEHVDPRLSTVNAILRVLRAKEKPRTCGDVMKRGVMSLKPEDTAEHAVTVMKRFDISQLPVFNAGKVIGSVGEGTIMHNLGRNLKRLKVVEIMEPAFPLVDSRKDAGMLPSMLEFNPAILVVDKGKVAGIVTKFDLLGGK